MENATTANVSMNFQWWKISMENASAATENASTENN